MKNALFIPFVPTDEERQRVFDLAGLGIPHADICLVVRRNGKPISENTLRKYFKEELRAGVSDANAKVARAMFKSATEGNVRAQEVWLKCRAGWTDKQVIDVTANVEQKITQDEPQTIDVIDKELDATY